MKAQAPDGPFRRQYRRTDLIVEAIVGVLIAVLVLAQPLRGSLRPDVTLTVERSALGRAIPTGFLGLSMEYTSVEAYAGRDPGSINPILVRLIQDLSPGQAPVLRIGGVSSDRTWWPVAGMPVPPGVRFTLDRTWFGVMQALTRAVSARLILGINLEAANPTLARAEATALLGGIGRGSIEALEPGNEPELYGRFAWYRAADGTRVTGRPANYDYPAFAGDFSRVAAALPRVPLAGPTFGNFAWTGSLGPFLAAQAGVRIATLHRYPLQRCFVHRSSARFPTIANLLSPAAVTGLADRLGGFAAVAHAHHVPLRIDELNTVSCGSVRAISGSFASALWATDSLFALVRAGVDGVNVHTFPGAGYGLFSFSQAGGHWRGAVWPEYYGLLLFARAAPLGSRLAEIVGTRPPSLKAWATASADGSLRVVLINSGLNRAHAVALRIPGQSGSASLTRLQGPGARARNGVSLGGQSFGAETDTGALQSHGDAVSPADGRYVVSLPAASAALLTFRRR